MPDDLATKRMETALHGDSPFNALVALAKAFKAEGMSQRAMYGLFDQFRARHHNDTDETKYNAILDTIDLIVGWCNPNERLFETDLRI
jgi:hypothetical protein